MRQVLSCVMAVLIGFGPEASYAQAVIMNLPQPGTMVHVSEAFAPIALKGMVIYPEDPLKFDFLVDAGDEKLQPAAFKQESQRLVNYFLASMTIPRQDLWVNLSPVEKDRIVPDALIKTEMGRDMLAQDYLLKQLTASMIYPEDNLGKTFWKKVYDEAYRRFGTTDIPVDTFNKVWIVPQKASVFEKGNAVYVVSTHLKVMLESDYQANVRHAEAPGAEASPVRMGGKQKNGGDPSASPQDDVVAPDDLAKQILRDIIIPELEKEVNSGKNFAPLRQIIDSLVLSQWYQDTLKNSILNKTYAGKNKIAGIDTSASANRQKIYDAYMEAYKKGVFNYIKEESATMRHAEAPGAEASPVRMGGKQKNAGDPSASPQDDSALAGDPSASPQDDSALAGDPSALPQADAVAHKYFSGGVNFEKTIPRDSASEQEFKQSAMTTAVSTVQISLRDAKSAPTLKFVPQSEYIQRQARWARILEKRIFLLQTDEETPGKVLLAHDQLFSGLDPRGVLEAERVLREVITDPAYAWNDLKVQYTGGDIVSNKSLSPWAKVQALDLLILRLWRYAKSLEADVPGVQQAENKAEARKQVLLEELGVTTSAELLEKLQSLEVARMVSPDAGSLEEMNKIALAIVYDQKAAPVMRFQTAQMLSEISDRQEVAGMAFGFLGMDHHMTDAQRLECARWFDAKGDLDQAGVIRRAVGVESAMTAQALFNPKAWAMFVEQALPEADAGMPNVLRQQRDEFLKVKTVQDFLNLMVRLADILERSSDKGIPEEQYLERKTRHVHIDVFWVASVLASVLRDIQFRTGTDEATAKELRKGFEELRRNLLTDKSAGEIVQEFLKHSVSFLQALADSTNAAMLTEKDKEAFKALLNSGFTKDATLAAEIGKLANRAGLSDGDLQWRTAMFLQVLNGSANQEYGRLSKMAALDAIKLEGFTKYAVFKAIQQTRRQKWVEIVQAVLKAWSDPDRDIRQKAFDRMERMWSYVQELGGLETQALYAALEQNVLTNEQAALVRDGKVPVEAAMAGKQVDGGIDARNIGLDRQGRGNAEIVSSEALEKMIAGWTGIQGVIVSVTPMSSVLPVFGI
ncbi:MAG: hypothetical protein HQL19_01330 [Candidatus Omnitrophica bacterium]|nr:hypothetical protein [Candidatus Omnitrophota bacterium]